MPGSPPLHRQGEWGTARSTHLPPSPRQQVVGRIIGRLLAPTLYRCSASTTAACHHRAWHWQMLGKGRSHPGYPLSPGSSSAPILHYIILSWSELKKEYKLSKMERVRLQGTNPAWSSSARCGLRLAQRQVTQGQPSQAQANPPELSSSCGRVSIAADLNLFQSLNHSGKKWKTPKPTFRPLHSLPHPKTSLKQHWGAGCVVTLRTCTQHLPMMCTMVLGAGGSRGPREVPSKQHSLQRAGSSPTPWSSREDRDPTHSISCNKGENRKGCQTWRWAWQRDGERFKR